MKKRGAFIIIFIVAVLIIPMVSAGFFQDVWNKITGKATDVQSVSVNISVTSGAPTIYAIYNSSTAITLTDAPNPTFVIINFSVTDPDGASNLNNASAAINLTKASEELRYNSTCAVKNYSGNYANYTCNVTMWWWDAAGTDWKIYANISDLGANLATNNTQFVTVNTLKGFVMTPSTLNFASLPAGSTNQTPTNNISMNNTGNVDIESNGVQINATDLEGETTLGQFLRAGNFSASPLTGGNIECNVSGSATAMVNMSFTAVSNTILAAGNYTKNDGTAQENVFLCLRQVGVELTQQAYSTTKFGTWTVKVV